MKTFHVRCVSEALWLVMQDIKQNGEHIDTRNGPAVEYPYPVATIYSQPKERVLFYPERDANPFFHCLESLWMLGGRNDVAYVSKYSGNIKNYSDDGKTYHGAYGYRWRKWFHYDQLSIAAHRLKTFPNDRRTVVSMWDATTDLLMTNDAKDLPCNTQIFFNVRNGLLNMTVVNRSNDMVWGAYGANAVHMSFLQEYMAAKVGVEVGEYTQFSNNLHAYLNTLEKVSKIDGPDYEPYLDFKPSDLVPLVKDHRIFDYEVNAFLDGQRELTEPFLATVAAPMAAAWDEFKFDNKFAALAVAQEIASADWRKACVEWIERRLEDAE